MIKGWIDVDLSAEQFLDEAIPMKGRMIHHPTSSNGDREESQLYDPKRGQCINSISRPILNQRLLESLPREIDIRFETKLAKVDFEARTAWGGSSAKGKQRPGQEDDDGAIASSSKDSKEDTTAKKRRIEVEVDEEGTKFDLIIGCDGSWSKVRTEMMRIERSAFYSATDPS